MQGATASVAEFYDAQSAVRLASDCLKRPARASCGSAGGMTIVARRTEHGRRRVVELRDAGRGTLDPGKCVTTNP